MSLKEYRGKRNFRGTPEPKGKVTRGKGKLRFVVQKHAASRTHYDFRLEVGGTFKSWAIPKGPSLNPLDQRLAVKVEDHPLDYGSFEGVIPRGNYGAGTVMIWDEGTFEERAASGRAADEKKLLQGIADGHITFILDGSKLSGEFALVKLKKAAEGNAWLLLKKRDASAAFRRYEPDDISATTGRSMRQIAEKSVGEGAVWLPGKGRQKIEKPRIAKIAKVKRKAKTAKALEPGEVVKRVIAERPKRPLPLPARAPKAKPATMPRRVKAMQAVSTTRSPEAGSWLYESDLGGHRLIAEVEKHRAQLHSRSGLSLAAKFPTIVASLRKTKTAFVIDGEAVETGKGKAKLTQYFVSDVLFSDGLDRRKDPLTERRKGLEALPIFDDVVCLMPVETDWKKASARAKRENAKAIVAKRADSSYKSGISRDWVKCPSQAKAPTATGESERDLPPLTNLDKIFWPKEKITKGDLIAYYRSISKTLMPYLIDRPQSLHRQPDGIGSEGFFQKDHQGYLPRRIQTRRIYSESRDKTVNYLLCQDEWTLLYLVNLGCIELNPWLSRISDLDKPDWAIIDLDPDNNTFDQVVEVALEVRQVLKSVGVDAWCKTSGASGLHLFVPTGGAHEYEDVRLFAERVCRIVHEKFPEFTSLERNPARRRGKMYLDFLQNRRGQTIAAPYCVRPRPGATVSTPLDWKEVKRGLDPTVFTIETTPKRLAKLGDLFASMKGKAYDLKAALRKLK